MHSELLSLYQADRQDRLSSPKHNTPAYLALRERDSQRRARVAAIIATEELSDAADYYHAAWIMNHGDSCEDARNAHLLALRSSDLGHRPARWLAAASYDRWQMYQGKPQKFGTNYWYDGSGDRLWDVLPETTDEERAAWDVPPLAEQLRKAEKANRDRAPMSDEEFRIYEANAPAWCKLRLKQCRTVTRG